MTEYYLAFSYVLGIGPMKFSVLVKAFGGVEKAYSASQKDLVEVLGISVAENFIRFRKSFDPVGEIKRLRSKNIQIVSQNSDQYPENLRNISDPPICIYTKGNTDILTPKKLGISVVGTRKPTAYGVQVTRKITSDLAEKGVSVISGLALGIDAEAHRTALDFQAPTIAVLGCGVDITYPAANKTLYDRILKESGVIISEFPPEMTVLKGLFISRNRIVSALSHGVLIVEGQEDSGALITARYAAEQGKDVFAIPSPITSQMSHAPHVLIKQGAKLTTSAQDILEEYGMSAGTKKEIDLRLLSKPEQEIVQILSERPLPIDEITRIIESPISQILSVLSDLELKGIIEKNSEGRHQLVA